MEGLATLAVVLVGAGGISVLGYAIVKFLWERL